MATQLLRQRSVVVTAALWLAANVVTLLLADNALPFDWPDVPGSAAEHVLNTNIGLLWIFGLMLLTYWLTRRRAIPDLAARVPDRATAWRETVLLIGYGILALAGGFVIARLFGWHPFGLHIAGSIFGSHSHVTPAEAIVWAGYNLVVYAVIPLGYFRRRYSAKDLGLVSQDRRGDLRLIIAVLLLESVFQAVTLQTAIGRLSLGQALVGIPLTFVLYLAGTVLPVMIFVYSLLVPRFRALSGSTATTVILGGVTYTLLHIWDTWTVFSTPANGALSIIFLFFTYFGPGMMKTVLTVRTGNAWTHVWAYHALAPHTLVDTPHVVPIFNLR